MRISSDIFPFASHPDYGYSLEYAEDELRRLGSPNASVVEKTIKDLSYHAEMLDLMGLPPDSIMIIHMGGVYGNKPLTLARFEETFKSLPEPIKRRLVLENDELGYSVTDLLPLCQKLSIPLVLDWHHHDINPGEATGTRLLDLIPSINELWTNRGMKPKQHYSESRPGAISIVERRAHSDRVVHLPPSTDDVDLMIEAKDKEQAVFKLYKLYNLHPVDDDVWIPDGKYKKETKMDRRVSRKKESRIQSEARTEIEIEVEEETYLGVRTRSQRRKKSKSAA
ncbi:UV-endonuclease UvdE-domain-containing protein [Dichotomocladium elegans]|nr:UV-endonuclease UvdE-domain-containing protein [Dichotomocladium elegans]